ncbi:hypothetical protein [Bradyrhizobium sp. 188]|uniref:hypothetical protein n=1 Tax=Bradyrhizobium sp. 188 TaxID=2782656 RepID=UPI001FF86A60|nr:hypothetical protein [Bradyrhizobium sp. 188]MCK1503114.1 hypothetical protein [Bradyrhizobium sp. 188]
MAQQNLNIGLSREQIRAAVQADFVELYAALNSAYGTNLVPRLLNSGLSDSQVLDFTRANFADLYAAVKAQGLTGAPRYLNAGLSSDQLRAATQANFTDLYTLLGGADASQQLAAFLPTGYGYYCVTDGNGNNLLILRPDASGNLYAACAPTGG